MKKTMKNIWKTLFVAALFASCSEPMEEATAPAATDGKAINFEVATDGGRAAFFQGEGHGAAFEAGDVIGLRLLTGGVSSEDHQAVEDKTMGGTYADSDAYLADNVQRGNYSLKDGVWSLYSAETTKWQALHWIDNTQNEICAFSLPMASLPDSKQANGPDNRYPHNINLAVLSATQVQAAANDHSHIGNYMIMSSDPQMFAKNEQPEVVNIQFQNVLSIVEVTLKSAETKSLMNLTMTSKTTPLAFTKGSLNATKKVSTGICPITVEEGVNEVTLSLSGYVPVTAEGSKFYFVVLPGAHAAGDITLTATMGDGSIAEIEMGAIEFKMNKVYRPEITLTAESYTKTAPQAEILHTYPMQSGFYGDPVPLVNDLPYALNKTYKWHNVPESWNAYNIVQCNASSHPYRSVIQAKTEGFAYLVTKAANASLMAAAGWAPVTPISGDEALYYNDANNTKMAIFVRNMAKDEEFDIKSIGASGFNMVQPLAKVIESKKLDDMVFFNFKSVPKEDDGTTSWGTATSMANCKKEANVYKSAKTYGVTGATGLEFMFSYTLDSDTNYWGTCYRKNTSSGNNIYELFTQVGTSPETIGLPKREGYKLVRVEGLCATTQNKATTLTITTDAEGATPVGVKEGSTEAKIEVASGRLTPWIFTIPNAEVNTRYYLAVAKNRLMIAYLYLTYEKVE